MSDERKDVVYVGWAWTLRAGWTEVCRGPYADCWATLKGEHNQLNARLCVLRAGEQPHEEPRTQRK